MDITFLQAYVQTSPFFFNWWTPFTHGQQLHHLGLCRAGEGWIPTYLDGGVGPYLPGWGGMGEVTDVYLPGRGSGGVGFLTTWPGTPNQEGALPLEGQGRKDQRKDKSGRSPTLALPPHPLAKAGLEWSARQGGIGMVRLYRYAS